MFRVTLQSGGAWLIRPQRRTQQMMSRSHGQGRKLCICVAHPKALASPFDTSLCTRRSQRCTIFRYISGFHISETFMNFTDLSIVCLLSHKIALSQQKAWYLKDSDHEQQSHLRISLLLQEEDHGRRGKQKNSAVPSYSYLSVLLNQSSSSNF